MTAAWGEVLDPVATDWLDECYLRSMRNLDPSSPYKAAMLIVEWKQVIDSGEFDRSRVGVAGYLPGQKDCLFECSVEGWITVDENGFPWKGDGHSYAKCCPVHRPQGWRIGDVNQSNYVLFAERMKAQN
jgi:hypothetical protein